MSLCLYSFRLSQGKDRLIKDEGSRYQFYTYIYSLGLTNKMDNMFLLINCFCSKYTICFVACFCLMSYPSAMKPQELSICEVKSDLSTFRFFAPRKINTSFCSITLFYFMTYKHSWAPLTENLAGEN